MRCHRHRDDDRRERAGPGDRSDEPRRALTCGTRRQERAAHHAAEETARNCRDEAENPGERPQRGVPRQRHPCLAPAPFGREPDGADEDAAYQTEGHLTCDRNQECRELDQQRFEHRPDQQRQPTADGEEHDDRHQRTAAAGADTSGNERDAGGQHDENRVVDGAELRHAEVELTLQGRETDQHRPADGVVGEADRASGEAGTIESVAMQLGCATSALLTQDPGGDGRERRAPDHLDVRGAPQRHVLPEQGVPHVVEREARQRDETAQRQQRAADADPPEAGKAHAVGVVVGVEREGGHAGDRDAEQADDDRVVSRRGERAVVAALVDVPGDVPVEAEHRDQQADRGHADGQRRPARQTRGLLGPIGQAVQGGEAALAVAHDTDDDRSGEQDRHDAGRDHLVRGETPRRGEARRLNGQRVELGHAVASASGVGTVASRPTRTGLYDTDRCHMIQRRTGPSGNVTPDTSLPR